MGRGGGFRVADVGEDGGGAVQPDVEGYVQAGVLERKGRKREGQVSGRGGET